MRQIALLVSDPVHVVSEEVSYRDALASNYAINGLNLKANVKKYSYISMQFPIVKIVDSGLLDPKERKHGNDGTRVKVIYREALLLIQ